ncbi:CU044_5270 family protein [Streptomyces sp. P17]|uniref:CU044_5270 family protein n=1 Tax=Streptomyces sp. P17 TaxID=3074716 RepID=UPI0028F45162|nr:CU044_5270 family protein [Streptomyces sp. P17]MDT9698307.1 CU044_5270 family protein [Streptomyces sp. P17]
MNTHPRRREQPAGHDDLAELLPAPGNPVLPQDRHAVLKEHLMRQLTEEQSPTPKPTARELLERPHSPRRRIALLAAPLALAAVVTWGVVAMDDETRPAPVTAAQRREAVQLLDRIATVAAERPAIKVRDDQYIYTKSRGAGSVLGISRHVMRDAVQREDWQAVDGKRDGWIRVDPLPSDADSTTAPDTSQRVEGPVYGAPYLAFRELKSLPTDPEALRKKLYSDTNDVESSQEEAVFEYIETVLEEATLLPDLSAALYRTAAQIPGIRVDPETQDAAGRKGIGLTYTDASTGDHTWVFDRSTLEYLGTTKTAFLEIGVSDRSREAPTS